MSKIRKPIVPIFLVLTIISYMFLIVISCQTPPAPPPPPGKPAIDTVPIPNAKDTSELSRIDHTILKGEIKTFREAFNQQLPVITKNNPGLFITESEGFNKTQLLELLKDTSCVGIRIYYGITKKNDRNELRMIIVGTNSQGKDLYFKHTSSKAGTRLTDDDAGLEYGQCCHGLDASN